MTKKAKGHSEILPSYTKHEVDRSWPAMACLLNAAQANSGFLVKI